jgi:hypothetical protein
LCNEVSLNYVSKLPDALKITSSSSRGAFARASTDPNVIFANLTEVVLGIIFFLQKKILIFTLNGRFLLVFCP